MTALAGLPWPVARDASGARGGVRSGMVCSVSSETRSSREDMILRACSCAYRRAVHAFMHQWLQVDRHHIIFWEAF